MPHLPPSYTRSSGRLTRRAADFEWLRASLVSACEGVVVPPLPHRSLSESVGEVALLAFSTAAPLASAAALAAGRGSGGAGGDEAPLLRAARLQRFLNLACGHPLLRCAQPLSQFLETPEGEAWQALTRGSSAGGSGLGGALGPLLQTRLMDVAGEAQTLAAALNHSAFNVANALGPLLAGFAITAGYGVSSSGLVGAGLALCGFGVWALARRVP